MVETIAAFCVGIGFAEAAALMAVLFRYAIPRAPLVFRLLLLPGMLASIASMFGIGWVALTGEDQVFGIEAIAVLGIYFIAQFFVWWIFVCYAVYHSWRRRRISARTAERIEGKVDTAAEVATTRHIQYTDEHMRMLIQTRTAAKEAARLSKKIIGMLEKKE